MRYRVEGFTQVIREMADDAEMGGMRVTWHAEAESLEELRVQCLDLLGVKDEEATVNESGLLTVELTNTEDGRTATRRDMQMWERGEMRLWKSTYTFMPLETRPTQFPREEESE